MFSLSTGEGNPVLIEMGCFYWQMQLTRELCSFYCMRISNIHTRVFGSKFGPSVLKISLFWLLPVKIAYSYHGNSRGPVRGKFRQATWPWNADMIATSKRRTTYFSDELGKRHESKPKPTATAKIQKRLRDLRTLYYFYTQKINFTFDMWSRTSNVKLWTSLCVEGWKSIFVVD